MMKDTYTSRSKKERSPSTPRWGEQRSPSTPRWGEQIFKTAEPSKRPQLKVLSRNTQEEWVNVGVKYTGKRNGPPPPLSFIEWKSQQTIGKKEDVQLSQGCKILNNTVDKGKRMKEREQKRNEVVKSPPPPLRFVKWEIEKETGGPGTNLMPPPPLGFVNPPIKGKKVQLENNRTPLSPYKGNKRGTEWRREKRGCKYKAPN